MAAMICTHDWDCGSLFMVSVNYLMGQVADIEIKNGTSNRLCL